VEDAARDGEAVVKHVLLLAYHFPPLGGAGVQRNTKVVHHLTELGYKLTVVTGPGRPEHHWSPLDESMTAEIPPAVAVHRLPAPEPSWTGSRVKRWLMLTRAWQAWWEQHAVPLALEHGRDADVVYASVSPYSTARAAARIARSLARPLVMDLEDPWALDEMLVHETALHEVLDRRAMGHALAKADAIVMNTPESAARVRSTFPYLDRIPVTSILNGYDADDFRTPAPARDDGRFRIVHTGSLHTCLGSSERSGVRRLLGGEKDVHVLSRSLVYLTGALEELLRERPELADRIELHLAGRLTDADRAVFANLPFVHEHGFLVHGETIDLVRSADLLFLPMHDVPPGRRVAIVPCKTYEYLASRRPILAAVPDGDARDFLEASGTARVCGPTDLAAMKAHLLDALEAGSAEPAANEELLARLERRSLAREVADVIEAVSTRASSAAPPIQAAA
jgi:glycosyltransferase involved in cell wall biosynthesis